MATKRHPAIKSEHHKRYKKISKADLVEAFRDLAREYLGDETDEMRWFHELERRVEIVQRERKRGNSMFFRPMETGKRSKG